MQKSGNIPSSSTPSSLGGAVKKVEGNGLPVSRESRSEKSSPSRASILARLSTLSTRQLLLPFVILGLLFWEISRNNAQENLLQEQISELRTEVQSLSALREEIARFSNEPKRETSAPASTTASQVAEVEGPLVSVTMRLSGNELDDPFLGPKDADTVVMVFSDFQCKNCRKFYEDSFQRLSSEFAERKKIKLVYRDFPLNANPRARAAASFAHCAGEQGEYWQAFSILQNNSALVDAGAFDRLSSDIERVDQNKFKRCLESGRYEKEIDGDIADARLLGVKGAPSTFIGMRDTTASVASPGYAGVLIRGAQPYALIKQELERVLSVKKVPVS